MSTETTKFVYFFGNNATEGNAKMKPLLGGKGANLAEMTNLGVPVPAGFTIITDTCDLYYKNNQQWPAGLADQVWSNLEKLESAMGAKLGDNENPLLVSVRSGAAVSMPGMMDTVLNLGLNLNSVQGLIKKTGNERFAWDSYRRFIQMFGDVVMEVEHAKFEHIIEEFKKARNVKLDTELNAADLKELVQAYLELVKKETGEEFPQEPKLQLEKSINAVFKSWNNPRAIRYRELNEIRHLSGTAVNVQSMVFGNMGDTSGTGVCFTRNPATGENVFYGEYLMNAQGEDVVAGIRTPQPIAHLESVNPEVYKELVSYKNKLESHYGDMQDIEFTIQEGKLYFLQTRSGKRTIQAAVQIACDLVDEGRITSDEAVLRIEPKQVDQLLHPTFDPKAKRELITKGLPASPGAATGKVVFTADEAERQGSELGEKVILVRLETSPEDISGMNAAQGILTARGGMTSHAAVVARGMGKCCVSGCSELNVDHVAKQFTVNGRVFKEGDYISLDGSLGEVYAGEVATKSTELSGAFARIMEWADKARRLQVRTNADTPHDAEVARKFGAQGIGLCRTEHMFFEGDRILAMCEMILADNLEDREKALAKLLPIQRGDFEGLFTAMKDLPVTIRLLDPPLHEFVPHDDKSQQKLADVVGVSVEKVKQRVEALKEFNPMLGHRGCRLSITYPEIADMQVRAIMEAACNVKAKGIDVVPEIMIPLIGTVKELSYIKERAIKTIEKVFAEKNMRLKYMIGTMIEIPRAALTADTIATEAEFFSFGTNDLTQMTFGYSRDDAGVFLKDYLSKGILETDPFQALDQEGVGSLVQIAIEKGRSVRKNLKIGICGEHGGEPSSVNFCHRIGLNYVSCSPYRVPVARLAAAQAAIIEKNS